MEEIRGAAYAYYEAGTDYHKRLAWDFFCSMDVDGDGRVSFQEYMQFLSGRGYPHAENPYFFRELDRNGDGMLDFYEVLTFYYVLKSGRPFCNGCRFLIKGLYFTCLHCHTQPVSFCLCTGCYRGRTIYHPHNIFLDNFALLHHQRLLALQTANVNPPIPVTPSIPERSRSSRRFRDAFEALEAVVTIGGIALTVANFTACSIM